MLRKSLVIISMLVLSVVSAGGSRTEAAARPRAREAAAPAVHAVPGVSGEAAVQCPAKATRRFAKTRFVVNAGLAAGAFKRYIYTPYRSNAFSAGAPHRKRAIVKAAVAGAFVLDQLRHARNNAAADPTLCKALIGPIDKLMAMAQGMAGRLKQGSPDPSDIGSFSGGIEGFRKQAGGAGAGFADRTPNL